MIRVGIVVQRYGSAVIGGSEALARNVAERLLRQGMRVTVFTTCARDYLTWRNEYPAGETLLRGVAIRRFPVVRERDIDAFNRFSDEFFAAPPSARDEKKWIAEQGPLCPDLVQALVAAEKEIDLFIFFTYLYYPTLAGLGAIGKPAILFPTAHDEPPLYLAAVAETFRRLQACFFLTQAEMDLVRRVFNPPGAMRLVRTGVDVRAEGDDKLFRRRRFLVAPYLLYAGRIEKGKGLEAVLDHYRAVKQEAYVDLVLIGKKLMELPSLPGLKYLGFVSEEEKLAAFKGALFSVQPSPLESLSISTLESFSQRTPVLVNRDCPALREHVALSGGGLAYGGADEFLAGFRQLYRHPRRRAAMGEKGLAYVKKYYSWDSVLAEIKKGIDEILAQ
ncbi:MAG: glycosyltransferase family 4 protein [Acidobacteria bacterium]|jgi:glycosyltransferase involved in cell wall biosynthesis|nr:glycosyltransferase family 4 protein [Acidobacteriota bacterium]